MTVARWISLVIGCLCMTASFKAIDTNIFDVLLMFIYRITALALVIVPLVLEFMERKI